MRVKLDYGTTGLDVELPEANVLKVLAYKQATPLADPIVDLREHLAQPLGTPPLVELARGRSTACLLICDITRPVPNALILGEVLPILESAGIPRHGITILIATGLHRPSTPEEIVQLVGPSIARDYRIENHYGRNLAEHVYLDKSPRGVPIWIDRRYVEADLKLTIGLIEPHMMAGYSGGRKLICPGIAALETVRRWHSPAFLEHPRAANGCLEGNPVHEENTWIARRAGCDMIVNVVIDAERRPVKFVVGDMEQAFLAGVEMVRSLVIDRVSKEVDVVVTSGAGAPLDQTFYQAVKGMVGALPIIKPGGTIILSASMREGIGSPEFQRLFADHATLEGFMDAITSGRYFLLDQWQLEEQAKVLRRARVKVVTDGLPPEVINRLFVESAPSVERAVADCLAEYGADASIAVIPKGPYVIPQVG